MTMFDQREAAIEAAFALHQDALFEARAAGLRDFASWAASELGKSPGEATIYIDELLTGYMQNGSVSAIVAKLHDELASAGRQTNARNLRARYDEAVDEATTAALAA
jgi:hypothetical protein